MRSWCQPRIILFLTGEDQPLDTLKGFVQTGKPGERWRARYNLLPPHDEHLCDSRLNESAPCGKNRHALCRLLRLLLVVAAHPLNVLTQ